jgi:hypothetical protein
MLALLILGTFTLAILIIIAMALLGSADTGVNSGEHS